MERTELKIGPFRRLESNLRSDTMSVSEIKPRKDGTHV